jgi:hypothetical protein
MTYWWCLARPDVLMTVNGDDALLMVSKNWGIVDG